MVVAMTFVPACLALMKAPPAAARARIARDATARFLEG